MKNVRSMLVFILVLKKVSQNNSTLFFLKVKNVGLQWRRLSLTLLKKMCIRNDDMILDYLFTVRFMGHGAMNIFDLLCKGDICVTNPVNYVLIASDQKVSHSFA